MRWYRYVAAFIFCIECVLFGWVGYVGYRYIQRRNILGATSVIPVNIDFLRLFSTKELPFYYDLEADQTETIRVSWLPSEVIYTYNRDGLHSRFDYDIRTPPETYRIVTMGDSFTFGLFVNTQDNFSEKLRDMLSARLSCTNVRAFEVINLGVPGYDLRYALERYTNKGDKYNPDLVVWFIRDENFFLNTDRYHTREEFFKQQLKTTGAAERLGVSADDQFAASKLSFKENVDAYNNLRPEEQLQFIQPEISALERWRSLYSPNLILLSTVQNGDTYKNFMKNFARSNLGTWYHEVSNIETFHPYDYHPNSVGHTTIADSLYQFLISQGLIDCQR